MLPRPGGMTGLELAREASSKLPNFKVLIVSGYPEPRSSTSDALNSEFRFLGKPYSQAELVDAISDILGSKQTQMPIDRTLER